MITQDRLKEMFAYSVDTGLFTRIQPVPGVKIGKVAGCIKAGYVVIRVDSVLYRAHRLAWLYEHNKWPDGEIDHINGIKSDNRICNLRDVSIQQNRQNQIRARRNSKSGILGVHFIPSRNKFRADICVEGRNKSLGHFDSSELAHNAYVRAKRSIHEGNTL